jgi:hypothetical protein
MQSLLPSTKPASCTIAMSLPLDETAFSRDWQNPKKDFASSIGRKLGQGEEASHERMKHSWEFYASRAQQLKELIQNLQGQGYTVIKNCSLQAVKTTLENPATHCLILFAHWLPHTLHIHQVHNLEGLRSTVLRLASQSGHLQQVLSKVFSAHTETISEDTFLTSKHIALSLKLLNQLLEAFIWSSERTEILPENLVIAREAIGYINREHLDVCAEGSILPGNRVELSDGLYSAEEFRSAIPSKFTGVLDLTVCNSVRLGEVIKKTRTCSCIAHANPVDLDFHLAFYKQFLMLLTKHPANYVESYQALRHELSLRIYKKVGKTDGST